ncbi:unnamed protein product [Cuscuta epithymum]|uniref:Uncharacterized protein n=1 Tax=Cuscuta epithymum TaxID=186058 RepID=A0AAV0GCN0_9ASTE|nr:unnamed protein product [Cuscuta epithymum]
MKIQIFSLKELLVLRFLLALYLVSYTGARDLKISRTLTQEDGGGDSEDNLLGDWPNIPGFPLPGSNPGGIPNIPGFPLPGTPEIPSESNPQGIPNIPGFPFPNIPGIPGFGIPGSPPQEPGADIPDFSFPGSGLGIPNFPFPDLPIPPEDAFQSLSPTGEPLSGL